MELLVVIVALFVLDLAAMRWGADSRETIADTRNGKAWRWFGA